MAAAGKWTELPSGGGIYGIWSQDRSLLYVGSTGKLATRIAAHRTCEWLGCEIEVGMSLPACTRAERNRIEDRLIVALRSRGIAVANPTNAENHKLHMRFTLEKYREHAKLGLGRLTLAQRQEFGRINGRKGALKRWRKEA